MLSIHACRGRLAARGAPWPSICCSAVPAVATVVASPLAPPDACSNRFRFNAAASASAINFDLVDMARSCGIVDLVNMLATDASDGFALVVVSPLLAVASWLPTSASAMLSSGCRKASISIGLSDNPALNSAHQATVKTWHQTHSHAHAAPSNEMRLSPRMSIDSNTALSKRKKSSSGMGLAVLWVATMARRTFASSNRLM